MLEHVSPRILNRALGRWNELLRPGGTLTLHIPNGEALARAVCTPGNASTFWAAQSAIYGYGPGPADDLVPELLGDRGDHRVLFTFPILAMLLADAGFDDVRDVSGHERCRHAEAWASTVPGLCLEVVAIKRSGP
jgi:hypothetical protein